MPTSRREFRTQNRSCPQGPMWASAPTQITKRSRKQKCLHRGIEGAAPYKGARSRPRPVGDGVVSAAVGGFAALRMRHTPCGCTPPCRHFHFCKRVHNQPQNSRPRRMGGHRPPAFCAAARLGSPLEGAGTAEGRDGRSPRAAACVLIWFAAKSKLPAAAG